MQKLLIVVRSFFLFLWIFSIPTSLAWHYNEDQGLVNGILVDYRIPSIFLSSLLLIPCIAVVAHIVHSKNTTAKIALIKTIFYSLVCTFLFQVCVGFFQFRFQQSLTGYLPFGEVNLKAPTISKGVFFDGHVYTLPYGTTVHPNILAGFCVLSFLLIFSQRNLLRAGSKIVSLIFFLTTVICFITQSLSASFALLFGMLIWLSSTNKNVTVDRVVKFAVLTLPILSFLFFLSPITQSPQLSASISRRSQLQQIAILMITDHPFLGVGWNNFTLQMENYGYISGSIRFLQPVHHVPLLLIAELGILGWIVITAIAKLILRSTPDKLILIGPLFLIASLDHYLLTLSTGRMMVLLTVVTFLLGDRVRSIHCEPQDK